MGFVVPSLWDDDDFISLTEFEQNLWMFLITGHASVGLPGLLKLGPAGVAEQAHKDYDKTKAALRTLEDGKGWIFVDGTRNLIRIPKAPRYNPPQNPNHVRGWYRKWAAIRDCQLKIDHVPSFYDVVANVYGRSAKKDGQGWVVAWNTTFGQFLKPLTKPQGELFGQGGGGGLNDESSPPPKALSKPSVVVASRGGSSDDWAGRFAEGTKNNDFSHTHRNQELEAFGEGFMQAERSVICDQESGIRDPKSGVRTADLPRPVIGTPIELGSDPSRERHHLPEAFP